jgi:hypothetical protein
MSESGVGTGREVAGGTGFHAWCTRVFLISTAVVVFGMFFFVLLCGVYDSPGWMIVVGKALGLGWLTSAALSILSIPWGRK